MIGLGSQYLTAAGFGRYRITAASLGNLDLLGTLVWLKPATKQAILGAFGDDGVAVINATNAYLNGIAASDRDKATALAVFINEDPMMVCSLGLEPQGVTMPIRVVRVDGTAYAITDIVADQDTFFSFNGRINATKASGTERWQTLFASDISVMNRAYGIWANDTLGGTLFEYNNAYSGYTQTIATNRRFYAEMNKNKAYVQYIGESSHLVDYNGNYGTFTTPSVMPLFKSFRNGSVMSYDCGLIGDCECVKAKKGNTERWYIPYKKEGVLELRDLETGNYATRVGTFTEAFYLPDGTPWTPSTP